MNTFKNWVAIAFLIVSISAAAQQDDHGQEADEVVVVEMTADERKATGVNVAVADMRVLSEHIRMPAEVVIDAYQSASVTTRIVAQVVKRHVKLGDVVESGDRLVTLSSVAMADAQGELLIADREWQRVRKLGKEAVSERRFSEAQIVQRQALAKVQAYGMTANQADRLLLSTDAALATGEFDLLAPQGGTILQDHFIVGELIEPGRVLFGISDESVLWVEASTVPSDLTRFEIGAPARVSHSGDHWIDGRVIQLHHQLDETTRRQGLRIEVDNSDDHLHPGQFVEAEISTGDGPTVLAVPNDAITLIDGQPAVFKLREGHEFYPQPIDTGASAGGWTEVRSGLVAGEEIAVEGIFVLKSLLLKATLGEGHAH